MKYTGKENRELRAKAHHIKPVVFTGKDGITTEIIEKINEQLKAHELIKVKIGKGPLQRKSAAKILAEKTGCSNIFFCYWVIYCN